MAAKAGIAGGCSLALATTNFEEPRARVAATAGSCPTCSCRFSCVTMVMLLPVPAPASALAEGAPVLAWDDAGAARTLLVIIGLRTAKGASGSAAFAAAAVEGAGAGVAAGLPASAPGCFALAPPRLLPQQQHEERAGAAASAPGEGDGPLLRRRQQ